MDIDLQDILSDGSDLPQVIPAEEVVPEVIPAKKVTKPIKYTPEFVLNEVKSVHDMVIANQEIIFIGEALESKTYCRQRYQEWAHDYPRHPEISSLINKTREILEARINKGAVTGKYNATMSIFNLKNHYGWSDKQEQDVTLSGKAGSPPVNINVHFTKKN